MEIEQHVIEYIKHGYGDHLTSSTMARLTLFSSITSNLMIIYILFKIL